MRVLVLGAGGREHALCWGLTRSASVEAVLCAPGNPGIQGVAETVAVDPADTAAVRELAVRNGVGLVVVGPEAPLVAGVADTLAAAEVPVFGPTAEAARIESSKVFAKKVMAAAGVPTARFWSGRDPDAARQALAGFQPPYVVKADGLAAGKGVRICAGRAAAEAAIHDLMVDQLLGAAGSTVLVEEHLSGPEVSVFGLCDGSDVVVLPVARDYKRVDDGNAGPNTGGMGAVCPVEVPPGLCDELAATVFRPVLDELASRGARYTGVLYAGVVLTGEGPRVLEFNARFGDPETQVVVPLLDGDLGELLLACATGALAEAVTPAIAAGAAVTVVLASGGYPGDHRTGLPITGTAEAEATPGAVVFHAGTRRDGDDLVTAGGRVLSVTGVGDTVAAARQIAYTAADRISFPGLHRRNDIAAGDAGRPIGA